MLCIVVSCLSPLIIPQGNWLTGWVDLRHLHTRAHKVVQDVRTLCRWSSLPKTATISGTDWCALYLIRENVIQFGFSHFSVVQLSFSNLWFRNKSIKKSKRKILRDSTLQLHTSDVKRQHRRLIWWLFVDVVKPLRRRRVSASVPTEVYRQEGDERRHDPDKPDGGKTSSMGYQPIVVQRTSDVQVAIRRDGAQVQYRRCRAHHVGRHPESTYAGAENPAAHDVVSHREGHDGDGD